MKAAFIVGLKVRDSFGIGFKVWVANELNNKRAVGRRFSSVHNKATKGIKLGLVVSRTIPVSGCRPKVLEIWVKRRHG